MTAKLILASDNPGKLKEFGQLLAPLGFDVCPQKQFNVPACPEPHISFVENALEKARHAARHTGFAALADDSGICVPALGGAPGVYSARYAGEPRSDAANNQKLVQAMAAHADKTAYYYCVLVFLRHAEDPQPLIADGRWFGQFRSEASGDGGFGYDPHFWLPELAMTAAQLPAQQKNQLSHRAQALRRLVEMLRLETDAAPAFNEVSK